MKSIIIKQNGKKIIHIKKTSYGFVADVLKYLDVEITIINNKNERIKLKSNLLNNN